MNCEKWENQILDYLEGTLDPEKSNELLSHISGCASCQQLLSRYQEQERLLERYYEKMLDTATNLPKPQIESPQKIRPTRRFGVFVYAAAAVMILFILSGLALFLSRLLQAGRSGERLGTAIQVMGIVQYYKDNSFHTLEQGAPVTSKTRLKLAKNSYLAVQLKEGKDSSEPNIIEFRENSMAHFHAYKNRLELYLDRGEVWVHLNHKPGRDFLLRTREGAVYDQGTIYNAAQGMSGMLVGVVTGKVLVEQNSAKNPVLPGEMFTSYKDKTGDTVRKHILWSHYRERLLSLLGPEEKRDIPDRDNKLLKVAEETGGQQLSTQTAQQVISNPSEFLPLNTRFLLEINTVPEIIRDWNRSDYSSILRNPALVNWWNSDLMEERRNLIESHIQFSGWAELVSAIPGSLSIGAPSEGAPLIIADCRQDPEKVKKVLDTKIFPLLERWRENKNTTNRMIPRIRLVNGYLVFGWQKTVFENTLKHISENKPTGFTQSGFYQNLMANVQESRLIVAYDFKSTIKNIRETASPDLISFLERSGIDGLDYILGSSDFAGQGINQAFRIAFTGPRHGVLGWLDEPGPMGSFRFYSPDVYLLTAARIKNPKDLLEDVLNWMFEDMQGTLSLKEDRILGWMRSMAACLGYEVAIGIQKPVFPVPNIQVSIEVLDPIRFHDLMLEWIEIMDALSPYQLTIEGTEYREQLIVTIKIPGKPFDISYAVLDDFLVICPGEPFVRRSIDLFLENHSLRDEFAFQSLLPAAGQLNFSFLQFYNIGTSLPELITDYSKNTLSEKQREYIPDLEFIHSFQTMGISYAFSSDEFIDIYINGSSGVDINLGGMLPVFAGYFTSCMFQGGFDNNFVAMQKRVMNTGKALEAFYADNKQYPGILEELLLPVPYLKSLPLDPFVVEDRTKLQYYVNETRNGYILYSVGPDGKDQGGILIYDPTNGTSSSGDYLLKKDPKK